MKKTALIVMIMIFMFSVETEIIQKKYLQHSDNSLSAIRISCDIDADCKLVGNIQMGCPHPVSVHKDTTQKEIIKFNENEAVFWVTKDLECIFPTEALLNSQVAKCNVGICGIGSNIPHDKKKKVKTEEVTLQGMALDAKAGAVLLTNDSDIYIDGLTHWTADYVGKKIRVTGLLEKKILPKAGNPCDKIVRQGIEKLVRQGTTGEVYILKQSKWIIVE